jgi:DNA repair protein RadC
MNDNTPSLPGFESLIHSIVKPFQFPATSHEYKIVPLRECATPMSLPICDTPQTAADYWRANIPGTPYFSSECECFVVLILNTRRRCKGHYLVSIGTQDSLLVSPREVFRLAIMTAANAIILTHNHPSGDATPSAADIKVTRDLVQAGKILKIEVLDHVILGQPGHVSLREQGYLYA